MKTQLPANGTKVHGRRCLWCSPGSPRGAGAPDGPRSLIADGGDTTPGANPSSERRNWNSQKQSSFQISLMGDLSASGPEKAEIGLEWNKGDQLFIECWGCCLAWERCSSLIMFCLSGEQIKSIYFLPGEGELVFLSNPLHLEPIC